MRQHDTHELALRAGEQKMRACQADAVRASVKARRKGLSHEASRLKAQSIHLKDSAEKLYEERLCLHGAKVVHLDDASAKDINEFLAASGLEVLTPLVDEWELDGKVVEQTTIAKFRFNVERVGLGTSVERGKFLHLLYHAKRAGRIVWSYSTSPLVAPLTPSHLSEGRKRIKEFNSVPASTPSFLRLCSLNSDDDDEDFYTPDSSFDEGACTMERYSSLSAFRFSFLPMPKRKRGILKVNKEKTKVKKKKKMKIVKQLSGNKGNLDKNEEIKIDEMRRERAKSLDLDGTCICTEEEGGDAKYSKVRKKVKFNFVEILEFERELYCEDMETVVSNDNESGDTSDTSPSSTFHQCFSFQRSIPKVRLFGRPCKALVSRSVNSFESERRFLRHPEGSAGLKMSVSERLEVGLGHMLLRHMIQRINPYGVDQLRVAAAAKVAAGTGVDLDFQDVDSGINADGRSLHPKAKINNSNANDTMSLYKENYDDVGLSFFKNDDEGTELNEVTFCIVPSNDCQRRQLTAQTFLPP
eukprot:g3625.t1